MFITCVIMCYLFDGLCFDFVLCCVVLFVLVPDPGDEDEEESDSDSSDGTDVDAVVMKTPTSM